MPRDPEARLAALEARLAVPDEAVALAELLASLGIDPTKEPLALADRDRALLALVERLDGLLAAVAKSDATDDEIDAAFGHGGRHGTADFAGGCGCGPCRHRSRVAELRNA